VIARDLTISAGWTHAATTGNRRVRRAQRTTQGKYTMKKILAIGAGIGLATLSACNSSPREQAADNIEANAESVADNLEDVADNVGGNAADALENQADATRAMGDNQAQDMRTNDPDTNLSNGM
jgi:hypothetical protein